MAQVKIKEAMQCVALASSGVSADDANVGAERMDYVARAMQMLNDSYALARSAVNGLPPLLLERETREKQSLMIAAVMKDAAKPKVSTQTWVINPPAKSRPHRRPKR